MHRSRLLALTAAAAVAVPAAAAVAQSGGPELRAGVSPQKAGTKRKPASATMRLRVDLPEGRRKTPSRITFRMPRDVRLSGTGIPVGTPAGSGVVTGVLSTSPPTPVTWTAAVSVASPTTLALAFKGVTPAAGTATITGHGRRLRVDVPPELRSPLDGTSTYVTGVSISFGASRTTGMGKHRRTSRLASLRGCPRDRRHLIAAEVAYARNEAGSGGTADRVTATAACRGR